MEGIVQAIQSIARSMTLYKPAGVVDIFAGATIPQGWLECNGASLLRADYPELYTAIGTTYGSADSTHFTLPNLKGRVVVGQDTGDTSFDVLGETGGEKTHTNSAAESGMPTHQHALPHGVVGWPDYVSGANWNGWGTVSMSKVTQYGNTSDATGVAASQGHNNLQPYMALKYIIKI